MWCSTRNDPFFDFWYGGAYVTTAGFIAGLIWQHLEVPGSLRQNAGVLSLVAVVSVTLVLQAFFGTDFGSVSIG